MKRKFKDLAQLVRFRNHYCGLTAYDRRFEFVSDIGGYLYDAERDDLWARLDRHRLANNIDMIANISSEERTDLGINRRWNAGNFNSWRIQRATHQYPQSSTE